MSKTSTNDNKDTMHSGEHVSSLVDGEFENELHASNSIDHIVDDKEASGCWERYHLISDALKRNLPRFIDNDLATRVMAKLENEPTVLAPPRTISSIGKQLAGLAIAASVATIAVFSVQVMYKEDETALSTQVAKSNNGNVPINKGFVHKDIQTVTQSLNPTKPQTQRLVQQNPSQVTPRYHPNINKYLLKHNQHAARGVVQGVIPYARIITSPDAEHIARKNNIKR